MSISTKLQRLTKENLVALIVDVSGRHDDIDDIITSYFTLTNTKNSAQESTSAAQLYLNLQVDQLTAVDQFFHYRDAHILQARCERLVQDIAGLAETDTEQALTLLDRILEQHGQIFNCVDDSDGFIGDVMHEFVQLWLQIATRLRELKPGARHWVEAVFGYYANNDYGCFDDLISNSACVLSENELLDLAQRFERDAQAAICADQSEHYNSALAHADLGLRQVAQALQDMTLYERSVLIGSPQPNSFELEDVIRYALELERFDRADYWLKQLQLQGDHRRYTTLNNLLLEQQGNLKQLKHNLLSEWQRQPQFYALQDYWQHANQDEQQQVIAELIVRMNQLDNPENVLQMLLFTGQQDIGAEYLIARYASLEGSFYSTVLNWLAAFEEAGQTLAVILCYRLLLLDVLDRGYSKAYRYAAHYFNALLVLDKAQPYYREFDNAMEFIAALQAKHGRKKAFWREAGYPAKSSEAR